jgi:DNA (cytosine-5)-methyltransferase 1
MNHNCPLILSIFPGVDLLGRALEEEWPEACVVRGPDLLWGGDIRSFHPPSGVWDGCIGGPPCQAFSRLRHIIRANGHEPRHGNLIPEFERVVEEARPTWFLMENVPAAPVPSVPGYVVREYLLDNRWLGESQQRRRRFSFGTRDGRPLAIETVALENIEWVPAVVGDARAIPVALGGTGKPKRVAVRSGYAGGPLPATGRIRTFEEMCELQGLPSDFLKDAPFTSAGKRYAVANGVPLPMGRAVARAVRRALIAATGEVTP